MQHPISEIVESIISLFWASRNCQEHSQSFRAPQLLRSLSQLTLRKPASPGNPGAPVLSTPLGLTPGQSLTSVVAHTEVSCGGGEGWRCRRLRQHSVSLSGYLPCRCLPVHKNALPSKPAPLLLSQKSLSGSEREAFPSISNKRNWQQMLQLPNPSKGPVPRPRCS